MAKHLLEHLTESEVRVNAAAEDSDRIKLLLRGHGIPTE
jgi:hypothetical protein